MPYYQCAGVVVTPGCHGAMFLWMLDIVFLLRSCVWSEYWLILNFLFFFRDRATLITGTKQALGSFDLMMYLLI